MPIARVEMPDGRIGRFEVPEGTTPEQVQAFASQQLEEPVEEPGFFSRVGTRFEERGEVFGEILRADKADEQASIRTVLQLGGNVLGAAGDVLGEGIVSAAKSLPDEVTEPVVEIARTLLDTDAGKSGISALSEGVEAWDDFAAENPAVARDIGALFNIATFFTPVKGVSAATVTGGVIKKTRGAGKQVAKLTTRAPVVTSDDIATLASKAYKSADDAGGTLTPKFTNKFIENVEKLQPKGEFARVLAGKDSPLGRTLDAIKTFRGKPISLKDAQEMDEVLGKLIDKSLDAGRFTSDSKDLLNIQTLFREGIEDAGPNFISGGKEGFTALKEARKLWAGSRRLADIEKIVSRAELATNPATTIKAGFRALASNPKRLRGFSKKEISLIRSAAKDGIVSDTLRTVVGSRLLPIIAAGSGRGLGGTAAAAAGSIAARGAAERGALRQAGKVTRQITKGLK